MKKLLTLILCLGIIAGVIYGCGLMPGKEETKKEDEIAYINEDFGFKYVLDSGWELNDKAIEEKLDSKTKKLEDIKLSDMEEGISYIDMYAENADPASNIVVEVEKLDKKNKKLSEMDIAQNDINDLKKQEDLKGNKYISTGIESIQIAGDTHYAIRMDMTAGEILQIFIKKDDCLCIITMSSEKDFYLDDVVKKFKKL